MRKLLLLLTLIILSVIVMATAPAQTQDDRVLDARNNVQAEFAEHFGKPVFIRIIKEDWELELWVQEADKSWHLLKIYHIFGMSGELGPKTAEGDEQAPEGFYRVYPHSMNPRSKFHLAFNIGYPNAYDRKLGRTGSFIMIHGDILSIGCFAMTDARIEEIYTMVNEAFKTGSQYVPVQVYPFRMTDERMLKEQESEHFEFWQHLLPGWQHTETSCSPYPDSDN
ncbi:MAG: 2-dehydro-3-deoxyphosphooctonate aldolase [Akkermansia sp.]|nr:2-dehydro-3-deoxyphosphooctonate aldolase [Akkermansia sp.]